MCILRYVFRLLLVLLCSAEERSLANARSHREDVEVLLNWLVSKDGGFFNDKLDIRSTGNNGNDGIFARKDISKSEQLLVIPFECQITAEAEIVERSAMQCETVYNLVREIKKKENSYYAPYINYVVGNIKKGKLPSAWSAGGKYLLMKVLGGMEKGMEMLPPLEAINWIENDWYEICEGSDDPLEEYAALLTVELGWDDILIPVYDIMNHRNGKWLNTESKEYVYGESVIVVASRDIKEGEELYMSHNLCDDCGNRKENYGTFEILRDYGFVENHPQRWIFGEDISFELDELINKNGFVELIVDFLTEKPSYEGLNYIRDHLERINDIRENDLTIFKEKITKSEWDVIIEFKNALMIAITEGVKAAEEIDGYCSIYDTLEEKNNSINFHVDTCDVSLFYDMKTLVWHGYDMIEEVETSTQTLLFVRDKENNDVCFELDGTLQICSSYRPQYHEMMVHYSARYLNEVKRVIWVGGGDSMLLFEILKYPNLELAVGLEIDQTVTRFSFKNFGTQPH